MIGVAFDGTGYGDDGASWGGEFLVADYRGYERAAHLAYVALPGGDAGVRNPCRMALSHLRSAGLGWDPSIPSVRACGDTELGLLDRQLETGLRCVPTSSMGRLFDAVASLAGICHRAGYDAQAAMELEAVARPWGTVAGYPFGDHADAAAVVAAVVDDVRAGVEPGLVAARFQHAVVGLVVATVLRLREETGLRHGDAQRRGVPQRVPHRGLRRGPRGRGRRGAHPPRGPGQRRRHRPRTARGARAPRQEPPPQERTEKPCA